MLKTLVSLQSVCRHVWAPSEPCITTPRINDYVETRLNEGAANATVNRELAALKRMLNLGAKQTPPIVDRVPHIPMLRENNARKGFFEHDQFLALRDALPEYLRNFVTFAYKTGWRLSEIADLTWARVDRHQGIVRPETGETKNDEGRTVYLDDELKDVINHQWEARKNSRMMSPYVFLNSKSNDKIKRFDKAWKRACKDAKIGNRIFHDLRRTAVRNMVRSGISESVAMMISGHKTRAVTKKTKEMFEDMESGGRNDLIFPDKKGKTIRKISNAYWTAIDELGLNDDVVDRRQKAVFHTCRHSYASWLVQGGESLYTVQKLMGHSTLSQTERYSHLAEKNLEQAVQNFEDNLLKNKEAQIINIKNETG